MINQSPGQGSVPAPSHSREPGVWKVMDEPPPPEPSFVRQVIGDLWEGLFTLIVWTLAMFLFGLPAILIGGVIPFLGLVVAAFTLAPALAGLMTAAGSAARGGFTRLGQAWNGTFHLYKRSVALALPLVLLLAMVLATGSLVRQAPARLDFTLAWAFQIGIALALAVLHIYLYPILALYDTSLKQTLALAAILISRCIWQTILLLALGAGLLVATLMLPLVGLFAPGVWSVIVVNATWRMARRFIPSANDGGPAGG